MKVQYSQPEYRVKNPYTPSQTYTQPNLVQSTPVVSNSIQSNPRIIGYHTVNLKDKNYQRTPHKTVLQLKSKSQHAESLGQSNNPITLRISDSVQVKSVNSKSVIQRNSAVLEGHVNDGQSRIYTPKEKSMEAVHQYTNQCQPVVIKRSQPQVFMKETKPTQAYSNENRLSIVQQSRHHDSQDGCKMRVRYIKNISSSNLDFKFFYIYFSQPE